MPPRPRPGERGARPYSPDDLDSLYATSSAFNTLCLVSLKPPPSRRISTNGELIAILKRIKRFLDNGRTRQGFPPALVVTEFDPDEQATPPCLTAGFHFGFREELTSGQIERLQKWWLSQMGLSDNQGRSFQYDAKGGGKRLREYLAKDVCFRGGERRLVKAAPAWLPSRLPCRL